MYRCRARERERETDKHSELSKSSSSWVYVLFRAPDFGSSVDKTLPAALPRPPLLGAPVPVPEEGDLGMRAQSPKPRKLPCLF